MIIGTLVAICAKEAINKSNRDNWCIVEIFGRLKKKSAIFGNSNNVFIRSLTSGIKDLIFSRSYWGKRVLICLASLSSLIFFIHSRLNQFNFSPLKIGLFLLRRSSENSRVKSFRENISLSSLGAQPRRLKKLTRASGR